MTDQPKTYAGRQLLDRLIKSKHFNDPDLLLWIRDIEREAHNKGVWDHVDAVLHESAEAGAYRRVESQLALNAGRLPWGSNSGSLSATLEGWGFDPRLFLLSLDAWGYEIVVRDKTDG